MWDVVIIGAGITGLVCALTLQDEGFSVLVIEKSRGVGGRVATRHLPFSRVDHGAPILTQDLDEGSLFAAYVNALIEEKTVRLWPVSNIYRACFNQTDWSLEPIQLLGSAQNYVASGGMTAIAKQLAKGLRVELGQRVTQVFLDEDGWQITTEVMGTASEPMTVSAKSVVMAIPSPQALDLCTPLVQDGLSVATIGALQAVAFDPCITVIAGYAPSVPWESLPWSELRCQDDPVIARVICDRHKREMPSGPCFVMHSTPTFAVANFDAADLPAVGQQMLNHVAQVYTSWFADPELLQVHRWRYAIATSGYPEHPLSAQLVHPLWICGEWCKGSTIQDAFEVGLEVAQHLKRQLIDTAQ